MKENIEYHYNLTIDSSKEYYNYYYFLVDNEDYYFFKFKRNKNIINDLLQIVSELNIKSIQCCNMISNINNSYITTINNIDYVLIKCYEANKIIELEEIVSYNNRCVINHNNKYTNKWESLWKNKIDYIEKQIRENNQNKIILESIDYYIGLAELAIEYITLVNKIYVINDLDRVVLSRERVYYPNYKINYFNPCNFIFDLEIRDISEYLKSMFFYGEDAFNELKNYLKMVHLSDYSYNLLFARLLYPSFYFDAYERYQDIKDEKDIIRIINKVNEYELFLKKAYNEISLYAKLIEFNF